jgi:hypothetical protein
MAGICDQCHRIGQKPKATLDDYEYQVKPDCDRHPGIDALSRYPMGVAMPMVVAMAMAVALCRAVVVRINVPMAVAVVPRAVVPVAVVPMAMRVVMVIAMLMVTVVVLLHGLHSTSVAQMSAFGASTEPIWVRTEA